MGEFTPPPWLIERTDDGWIINGQTFVDNCYEEHESDAKLMAVAPEMYKALETIIIKLKLFWKK